MKRLALLITLSAIIAISFSSCKKEVCEEPGPIICYTTPEIPVRVINTTGDDLLSPSKLPSRAVRISWNMPGDNMAPVDMNPGVYAKQGQPDQYFFSVPIPPADRNITVIFSLEKTAPDTLYLRTASNSSKPYSLAEITLNGKRTDPKMLFGGTVYGLELVKVTSDY